MSAQSFALLLSLGPADVLLEHLIAVLDRSRAFCRHGSGLRIGSCLSIRRRLRIGRTVAYLKPARGSLRTVFGDGRHGGVGIGVAACHSRCHIVRLLPRLLEVLEHRVNDYRRHYQHRAQHEYQRKRPSSAFFHLFGYLPFAFCVLSILHCRGLDRLPYGDDRLKLRVFLLSELGDSGRTLVFEFLREHFDLLGADRPLGLLLRALGFLLLGLLDLGVALRRRLIDLHARLRLRGSFSGRLRFRLVVIALFYDADHHPLYVAQVVVILLEDGLGARHIAEVKILDAAVEHGAQLVKRLVPVCSLEAYALFDYFAEPAPRRLGRGVIISAHAAQLRVAAFVLKRESAAADGIVHQHADGIDVGRCGELPVPVQLRRDELELLALPGAFSGRADGDAAVIVNAYVARVYTAAAAS